jgi:hypothetical protein
MTTATARLPANPWRTIGIAMTALIALFMLVNFVRVIVDAEAFARAMGLPLADARDTGFVMVYGLRAAFLGLFALLLLLQRRHDVLKWFALVAIVMPIGDLWLTLAARAPAATVARHAATALYLIILVGIWHKAGARQAERN